MDTRGYLTLETIDEMRKSWRVGDVIKLTEPMIRRGGWDFYGITTKHIAKVYSVNQNDLTIMFYTPSMEPLWRASIRFTDIGFNPKRSGGKIYYSTRDEDDDEDEEMAIQKVAPNYLNILDWAKV